MLTNKPITTLFIISFIVIFINACSEKAKLQALDVNADILAFGDSLTYGTGTSRDKAYPAVLAKMINRNVINAGVPGEISEKGLSRLASLIAQHQPDLIIICHGANDILRKLNIDQTKSNLQKMIDLAKQNNSQVVLIAVPEFSLFLNTSPIYLELAEENQLPVANDILAEILANNAYKADHIHPNAEGYQLLAAEIASILKQSGGVDASTSKIK
jgi:acyl-CoA thioesterase-1